MKLPRRYFLHLAACAAALPAVSRVACAQAYPTRPITIVDTFPPGGSTGIIARIIADKFSETLGSRQMTFVAGLPPSVRNRWRQRLKNTPQILIAKKPSGRRLSNRSG